LLSAVLAALAKRWIVTRHLLRAPEARAFGPYLGVGVLEFALMLCACAIALRLAPSPRILVLFGVACAVFVALASPANLLFWRAQLAGAGTRLPLARTLAHAAAASLLLPAFAWALGQGALRLAY
jgi:hypothetical protein